jgi:hypothetical protein
LNEALFNVYRKLVVDVAAANFRFYYFYRKVGRECFIDIKITTNGLPRAVKELIKVIMALQNKRVTLGTQGEFYNARMTLIGEGNARWSFNLATLTGVLSVLNNLYIHKQNMSQDVPDLELSEYVLERILTSNYVTTSGESFLLNQPENLHDRIDIVLVLTFKIKCSGFNRGDYYRISNTRNIIPAAPNYVNDDDWRIRVQTELADAYDVYELLEGGAIHTDINTTALMRRSLNLELDYLNSTFQTNLDYR